ncbi:unnamed protein product [Brassica oleracea]
MFDRGKTKQASSKGLNHSLKKDGGVCCFGFIDLNFHIRTSYEFAVLEEGVLFM